MTPEGLTRLQLDEGIRLFVYNDANGSPITYETINGYPTIGYGRNLASKGITLEEAKYLINNDISDMWNIITGLIPWIVDTDPVRQDVVIMVDYNTGNVFNFKKMLLAIKNKNWTQAAIELMNSDAARELPERYIRMKNAILDNIWQ